MQQSDKKPTNALFRPADALKPEERKYLAALFLTKTYDDRAKLISSKEKRAESTCERIKEDREYYSWLKSRSRLL